MMKNAREENKILFFHPKKVSILGESKKVIAQKWNAIPC